MRQSGRFLYLAFLQLYPRAGLLPAQERVVGGEPLLWLVEPGLAVLPGAVHAQQF